MHVFHTFLESLKNENNSTLIESIHLGFSACFEVESESELTRDEWIDLQKWRRAEQRKPPRTLSLKYPYEVPSEPRKDPEGNAYVPMSKKMPKKPRYYASPEASKIKRDLLKELGGYDEIQKKGKFGWIDFQKALNKKLYTAGL
jgi:hypothetical protein